MVVSPAKPKPLAVPALGEDDLSALEAAVVSSPAAAAPKVPLDDSLAELEAQVVVSPAKPKPLLAPLLGSSIGATGQI